MKTFQVKAEQAYLFDVRYRNETPEFHWLFDAEFWNSYFYINLHYRNKNLAEE